jgi:hypothetical protein
VSESRQEFQASVGPPVEPDYLRPVYANHANVNHTPHDFRITFALLQTPLEVPPEVVSGDQTIELRPQAVATVVIPASLMHAFMGLLTTQFNRYLDQFGAPGLDPQGPGGQT